MRTLLILLCMLLFAGPVLADETPEHKDIEAGLAQLNLTPEQAPKVKAALAQFKTDIDAAKAADRPLQKMRDAKAARAKLDASMQAILTPQQYATYQELVDEIRAKRQQEK